MFTPSQPVQGHGITYSNSQEYRATGSMQLVSPAPETSDCPDMTNAVTDQHHLKCLHGGTELSQNQIPRAFTYKQVGLQPPELHTSLVKLPAPRTLARSRAAQAKLLRAAAMPVCSASTAPVPRPVPQPNSPAGPLPHAAGAVPRQRGGARLALPSLPAAPAPPVAPGIHQPLPRQPIASWPLVIEAAHRLPRQCRV